MLCGSCATQLQKGAPAEGRFFRVFKAVLFGSGAGLVGAIGYSLIITFAHIELALITILIGWLVGTAVMKGAEMRGGLGYQVLSALMTYVFCMMSYVPMIVQGAMNDKEPVGPVLTTLIAPFAALALPFTGDMGFLGTLILAFGVWQGFKIPKAPQIVVNGPFALSPAAAPTAAAVVDAPPHGPAEPDAAV